MTPVTVYKNKQYCTHNFIWFLHYYNTHAASTHVTSTRYRSETENDTGNGLFMSTIMNKTVLIISYSFSITIIHMLPIHMSPIHRYTRYRSEAENDTDKWISLFSYELIRSANDFKEVTHMIEKKQ